MVQASEIMVRRYQNEDEFLFEMDRFIKQVVVVLAVRMLQCLTEAFKELYLWKQETIKNLFVLVLIEKQFFNMFSVQISTVLPIIYSLQNTESISMCNNLSNK